MSKIRLKCDVCGGTFQDQYTKIICSYCEKKEMQLYSKEKQELIEKFLQKLDKVLTFDEWGLSELYQLQNIYKEYQEMLK